MNFIPILENGGETIFINRDEVLSISPIIWDSKEWKSKTGTRIKLRGAWCSIESLESPNEILEKLK